MPSSQTSNYLRLRSNIHGQLDARAFVFVPKCSSSRIHILKETEEYGLLLKAEQLRVSLEFVYAIDIPTYRNLWNKAQGQSLRLERGKKSMRGKSQALDHQGRPISGNALIKPLKTVLRRSIPRETQQLTSTHRIRLPYGNKHGG